MTCICGLVDGKKVWLGGDRAATGQDLSRVLIKHPKIFAKGNVAIGVCGLPKVLDAVQHGIQFPERQNDCSAKEFLINYLVPAIRAGLHEHDCIEEHNGQAYFHGAMLIAYCGELHQLECNFQLCESARGFDAVGSGAEPALGSLRATRGQGARKRILNALKVSAENNAGVAPPFDVVFVKGR